jgi:hypothetical protein
MFTDSTHSQLTVTKVASKTGVQTNLGTFTQNYVPFDFRVGQNGNLYIVSNAFTYDLAFVEGQSNFVLGGLPYPNRLISLKEGVFLILYFIFLFYFLIIGRAKNLKGCSVDIGSSGNVWVHFYYFLFKIINLTLTRLLEFTMDPHH